MGRLPIDPCTEMRGSLSPFLSRLLRLLPPSASSLSAAASFLAESRLSQLICRLRAVGPKLEGLYSGVFFAEFKGLKDLLCGVLVTSAWTGRLTLVKPELTAVKPPELMARKPDVTGAGAGGAGASAMGVSCSASFFELPLMLA